MSNEQKRDPETPQTSIDFQSSPDSPIHAERKWSPAPTSIEEAAALLGTSITRINNELIYRITPAPPTLHSSFSTVKPVPCSELYVRLQALKYLLEQQVTDDDTELSPVDCVVGIIPLLHKLLFLSSELSNKEIYLHASHETLPDVHPLVNIVNNAVGGNASSSHSNNNVHTNKATTSNNIKVPPVRITPPLASVPIRNAWIETLTLVHKLAPTHKLPSTNPLTLLSMYFEYAASHPKSSKSKGGVRVACLGLLGSIASDKILAPKYTRAIFAHLVTIGNNGLKSSGAGDVVHRIASIQCVKRALIGWRDSSLTVRRKAEDNGRDNRFISTNRLEERVLGDCVKLIKKASEDKYAEVRQAGAEFAAILSTMMIPDHRGMSSHASSSRKEVHVLSYMDEVMAICLRNLDDESVGVSVVWSESLARCICTAVEYHSLLNTSSTGNSGESNGHASSSNGLTSNVHGTLGKNDFAAKFKAFHDARKAVNSIATSSCFTLESVMTFLVQHFVKVGGDSAARMGGSFSMGGRQVRVGLGLVLVYLCRMQLECGCIGISSEIDGVSLSVILKTIMEMVGQGIGEDSANDRAANLAPSYNDLDDGIFDVTLSPKRKNISTPSMGGLLKNISGEPRHKHPFDTNVARSILNRVVRRGLTENMPEWMQLVILRDLVTMCKRQDSIENTCSYNRHQIQVALIEIANLVHSLGEACSSYLVELIPVLMSCVNDSQHGIRHEAAVAFQAVVVNFPSAGRKYIMTAIGEIQVHYDEILALGASSHMIQSPLKEGVSSRRGLRKVSNEPAMIDSNIEKSLEHQYCIHGNALLLSLILQVLPKLSGGLPSELLDIVLAVADNLISCQGSAKLVANNPGSLILCVRSGYNIISGVLSIGPNATIPHVSTFFNIWTRSANFTDETNNRLEPHQSISCIESFITSIVVFLQNNADLLISEPDTLRRISQILEKIFPIISGYSQISNGDGMSLATTRLDNAKAAIMEAFAWLPSGSFPLVSDGVFSFASRQIQVESKNGTMCTILPSLLSSEDDLLEYRLSTQVNECDQFPMAELEENLEFLNSNCIGLSEREAVIHLLINQQKGALNIDSRSQPVPRCQQELIQNTPTSTDAHEVGTWLPPPVPSRCAKVRLLNISVHLFSRLFRLQGGHQQTSAVTMLKDMMISIVGSGLEDRCAINIASTLLSSLKASPSKEHPNKINTESSNLWMVEAASAFLTLLPLSNGRVRRAAAEGLSLISSQGGTNGLQSSILRSLENVMATEAHDVTQAKSSVPTSQSTFAGCLLTFGCIQRESHETHASNTSDDKSADTNTKVSGTIPTMLMLTRLLPHIATHRADEESFFCRAFALHSFSLLLSHSKIVDNIVIDSSERAQLLFKAVEVVESNFYSAWMTNSIEGDTKGIEDEKMAFEPTLLAVLIRLMTYLTPRLYLIQEHDGNIASRFFSMTKCMLKLSNYHPGVVIEALSFLESLCSYKRLLSIKALSIPGTDFPETTLLTLTKHVFELSKPKSWLSKISIFGIRDSNILRAAVKHYCVLLQDPRSDIMTHVDDNSVASDLIEMLEVTLGSMTFSPFHTFRDMAFNRVDNRPPLLLDLRSAIEIVFKVKIRSSSAISQIITICKNILQGDYENYDIDTRSEDSTEIRGSFRWQIRYAIAELLQNSIISLSSSYDLSNQSKWLISTACSLSVSTNDESELFSLQKAGINMICILLQCVDHDKKLRKSFEEMITQILPSVRQALNYKSVDGDDSIDKEGARLLHFSGCDCFSLLYSGGMIHDVVTYKRLAKMLIPFIESCEFSSYPEKEKDGVISPYLKPKSFVDDRTSILLPHLSAISALSRIYLSTLIDPTLRQIFLEVIDDDISKSYDGIVSMSAALAIDGCRLKTYSENPEELILESGLTFHNLQDVDTVTKDALIQASSSLACFSVILSISRLSIESHDSTDYTRLMAWTKKTVCIVQSEFYSTFQILIQNPYDAKTIEAFKNIIEALKGIVLFKHEKLISIESLVSISKCVFQLLSIPMSGSDNAYGVEDGLQSKENNIHSIGTFIEPTTCSESNPISNKEALSIDLVTQACSFVESVCSSLGNMKTALFLEELTRPLLDFQKYSDASFFDNLVNATIFDSFIRGLISILSGSSEYENIIKSLLNFGLQTYQLLYKTANFPSCLSELIKFCLSNDAISIEENMLQAVNAAKSENWDLWELCVGDNLSLFSGTVIHMRNALADHDYTEKHLKVLLAASESLKSNTDMIPIFMGDAGPYMLELLHLYGINTISGQHRTLVCATCTKIIMLAYQYLSLSKGEEEDMIMFLTTVFEVFTSIVSHNGVPNQEVFNNGSDPSLGRMGAQFFVHVLRASPAIFKTCMCRLKEEAKLILESTVRADMSGYPPKEPVKKKLNLESFRRL